MTVEIKPLGELELWNRPSAGHVGPWVRLGVLFAAVLGVLVAGVAAWTLWKIGGSPSRFNEAWFHRLPPFSMLAVLTVLALPDGKLSRSIRIAVALPLLHAVALVFALFYVPSLDMPQLGDRTPMMRQLPVELLFAGGLVLALALARMIAGRPGVHGAGRREWAHAFVMIALANVLLLGLWLPIVAHLGVRTGQWGTYQDTLEMLEAPGWLPLFALAPPLVIAALYTTLSIRAPGVVRRIRAPMISLLILLFGGAVVARYRANGGAFLIHDNFIHALLAGIALAIVATSTLAVSTWWASRRALRQLAVAGNRRTGKIDDDESDVVACMQITSWLRGPRVWMRSFVANTGGELVRVPGGAELATAVPKISSAMRTGEAVVVIGRKDEVVLGGFVKHKVGESPFRAMTMTVPGPSGILVGRAEPASTPVESMLLTAWRPSVAYLLILLVIAVPSLIGLVVPGSP